ncbi:hypothetical protein Vafri_21012 [Volvox africanus]|uniref:J domain-containing protein n=1 Tax=Volvox africanus TaxID=51714 RepID=A0A8J4FAZ0_9CHLO|nr:hypothetical protein Vafri_21012 [Volvox africanus]
MSGVNYYQLLGIHATATEGEIRRAYLRLSLLYHPDKRRTPDADADERYRSIQEAYETLTCPEKRCLYDFVGSFAALAELTSSPPVAMPIRVSRHRRRGNAAHAADVSAGIWCPSSCGEALQSWDISSSLASATRMSPCHSFSDETGHLSSSLGATTGSSSSASGCLAATCNEPGGGGSSGIGGGGSSRGLPPLELNPSTQLESNAPPPSSPPAATCGSSLEGDFGGSGVGSSCSPFTSPGTLLGKRRVPGADGTQLPDSPPPAPWLAADSHLPSSPPPVPQSHLVHSHLPQSQSQPLVQPQPQLQPLAAVPWVGGDVCGSPSGRRVQSADVHHRLLLTLEEMYSGCVKQLRLARKVYKPAAAAAAGLKLSSSVRQLPVQDDTSGEGGQQQLLLRRDGDLAGSNNSSSSSSSSSSCWCAEELFRVVVQPGWREGTKVTFQGKGNELPCGSRGDMILVVVQAAHGRYERRGNDLHITVAVPLVDALTGGDTAITTLDGRTLVLKLGPACLQPFSERVVRGEGMPILPSRKAARGGGAGGGGGGNGGPAAAAVSTLEGTTRGDLHVRFEVSFPADLTMEQKAELRQALLL